MRQWINRHPAISMVLLMAAFILGSAIYLSNSDIKFTIKDDTRTVIFTFAENGYADSTTGAPLPTKMEIKPELLDKVRTLQFEEAVYFCVITFATIGYGDVTPVSREGRFFITWFALVSVLFTLIGIPYIVANWHAKECRRGEN